MREYIYTIDIFSNDTNFCETGHFHRLTLNNEEFSEAGLDLVATLLISSLKVVTEVTEIIVRKNHEVIEHYNRIR